MARDVFNRQTDQFGGSFSADGARVTFPALADGSGSEAGVLMQNLSVNYQQSVTMLYELGSSAIYSVRGRAQGQSQVERILGPRMIAQSFYRTYGDVCNMATNLLQISVRTGCGDQESARASYSMQYVVLTGVAINAGSEQMIFNESLTMRFASLEYA